MAIIGKDLEKAIKNLNNAGLVGIPTETVYGLAGNCYDAKAIARIFEVKNRPYFDPLIAHASGLEEVKRFVTHIPDIAQELIRHFWPGPLTLLLKKKEIIPDIVTAGLDTVAVRVPKHPLTLELLQRLEFPLAAPSANPFGYISPTTAAHVQAQLGEKIEYILDGGACNVGIESTIIGFEEDKPVVHRLGGLSLEEIEAVAGPVKVDIHSSSNPTAPGMVKSHYAPKTPIEVGDFEALFEKYKEAKLGILSFRKKISEVDQSHIYSLSDDGDLEEAATRLFSGLRALDEMGLDVIITSYVPDTGLGKAINDRLTRAAAKQN